MSATVRDVMTTNVIAIKRQAEFKEIVTVLRRFRVSACPVINDDGKVLGVVSEADLLYKETDPNLPSGLIRLRWKLGEESKATAVTAGRLMTSPAVTIDADASVIDAARIMQNRRIKRLPVVDRHGELVGIVTRSDVLAVYERSDDDILAEVTEMIMEREFGLDPHGFDVSVSSGVVTIVGLLDRPEVALNLLARVRHAEGVVSVRDRLSVPDGA